MRIQLHPPESLSEKPVEQTSRLLADRMSAPLCGSATAPGEAAGPAGLTRREFLRRTALASGAMAIPYFVPAAALGRDGAVVLSFLRRDHSLSNRERGKPDCLMMPDNVPVFKAS